MWFGQSISQMSNMADAAARREARKRRILENSQNRLQLIAGKASEETLGEVPVKSYHFEENIEVLGTQAEPATSCLGRTLVNNGALITESDPLEFLLSNRNIDAAGDNEVASDFAGFMPPQPAPVESPSLWDKLVSYKYDVVLLSIALQILYTLASVDLESVYIFLPLAIYVVMKLAWSPVKAQSSIANALLMMQGISQKRVQNIMFVAQLATTFSQDVFIFLFTTICLQSLFKIAKEKLVT